MITIILTGGIGSGKSTASSILKELGAIVIDTDKEAHEVLNNAALPYVIEAFGRGILTDQGAVDRKKLAQIVFNNNEARAKLNEIIHTRLDIEIVDRLKKLKEQGIDTVVVELPLFSEAPWTGLADITWIVKAAKEVTLERLKGRGLSEAESLARMAAQKPAEESVKGPRAIIDNNGNQADLKASIEKLWQAIHNECRGSAIAG
jgi:dephospho-CoA kinase